MSGCGPSIGRLCRDLLSFYPIVFVFVFVCVLDGHFSKEHNQDYLKRGPEFSKIKIKAEIQHPDSVAFPR